MLPAGRGYTTFEMKVNYVRPLTVDVDSLRAGAVSFMPDACVRLEHEESRRVAMSTRSDALITANASGSEPVLKYVHANGVRFAYLEQGSGRLVMFMHGFPDNAWSYRAQLQAFADAGYRAVAPFLRGYAPTGIPPDGIFDPIALGKDLEALIAALSDDGQACVVGMDWGGTSIFQALATAPSAIKAAVVMNTAHPIAILQNRKDPEFIRSIFHVFFSRCLALTPWSISRDFLSSIIFGGFGHLHSRTTSISVRSRRRSALPVP